jgi:hypothetical protein
MLVGNNSDFRTDLGVAGWIFSKHEWPRYMQKIPSGGSDGVGSGLVHCISEPELRDTMEE